MYLLDELYFTNTHVLNVVDCLWNTDLDNHSLILFHFHFEDFNMQRANQFVLT